MRLTYEPIKAETRTELFILLYWNRILPAIFFLFAGAGFADKVYFAAFMYLFAGITVSFIKLT